VKNKPLQTDCDPVTVGAVCGAMPVAHNARRQFLFDGLRVGLGAVALGPLVVHGQSQLHQQESLSQLPVAMALPAQLAQALDKKMPLVVMVSLAGCPYCKIARENYLLPLLRQSAIAVVQLDMQSKAPVTDFAGLATNHSALIERWRINIAPTVLFFGARGTEVAERLVGGYLPDFYGAYLQDRLAAAQRAVR
jgi:thioredoxin-related protein